MNAKSEEVVHFHRRSVPTPQADRVSPRWPELYKSKAFASVSGAIWRALDVRRSPASHLPCPPSILPGAAPIQRSPCITPSPDIYPHPPAPAAAVSSSQTYLAAAGFGKDAIERGNTEYDSNGREYLWSWASVHVGGVLHFAHDHPRSLVSGTIYINLPAGVRIDPALHWSSCPLCQLGCGLHGNFVGPTWVRS